MNPPRENRSQGPGPSAGQPGSVGPAAAVEAMARRLLERSPLEDLGPLFAPEAGGQPPRGSLPPEGDDRSSA